MLEQGGHRGVAVALMGPSFSDRRKKRHDAGLDPVPEPQLGVELVDQVLGLDRWRDHPVQNGDCRCLEHLFDTLRGPWYRFQTLVARSRKLIEPQKFLLRDSEQPNARCPLLGLRCRGG